jgi:superfamily II DNA/RNA helicase
MATLSDFVPAKSFSLQDAVKQKPSTYVNNEPSNRNLAAFSAAVSGDADSLANTYLEIEGQLEGEGRSETAEAIKEQALQTSRMADREALVQILSDPDIPFEVKQTTINRYSQGEIQTQRLRDIVALAAVSEAGED